MKNTNQVLQDLIDGNKRFYSKTLIERPCLLTLSKQVSKEGQFPKVVVLACMDSRSIPEIVFDQSIGDMFTLRVAGNVVSDHMLASMEFATQYAGAKVILIMGHTQCNAIKIACEGMAGGNIESLVATIEPAIATVREQSGSAQLDCNDGATLKKVALQNVHNMKARVLKENAVIQELLSKGEIIVVGALHDLETGIVTFE